MSYPPILCENYREKMCIYVNENIAIFEKCPFEIISEKIRNKYVENCIQRKTIEKIKINHLEEKLKK